MFKKLLAIFLIAGGMSKSFAAPSKSSEISSLLKKSCMLVVNNPIKSVAALYLASLFKDEKFRTRFVAEAKYHLYDNNGFMYKFFVDGSRLLADRAPSFLSYLVKSYIKNLFKPTPYAK